MNKNIVLISMLCSQVLFSQSKVAEIAPMLENSPNSQWHIPLDSQKIALTWHERKSSFSTEGIRSFVGYHGNDLVAVISLREGNISGTLDWEGKHYRINTQNGEITLTEDHISGHCGAIHQHNEHHTAKKTSKIQPMATHIETSTPSKIKSDGILRIYRLAVLVDYSYFNKTFNNDIQQVKDFWARLEVALNEIYMRDLAIKFELVNNPNLIITTETQQVFKGQNSTYIVNNSTTRINNLIGEGNYDLGISLTETTTSGENGYAMIGGAFINRNKGAARAKSNNSTIAHEIGHLFGGWHTYTGGSGKTFQTEPRSGSSVMGYDQRFPRDFFSLVSIEQIKTKISENAAYYPDKDRLIAEGVRSSPNMNVPYGVNTLNTAPVIDRTKMKPKYQLPPETGFQFVISATDIDGDPLIYTAHQSDKLGTARFYSAKPSSSSIIEFNPQYNNNNYLETFSYFWQSHKGTYTFWLSASDGDISPNATQKENHATRYDVVETLVEVVNGTPFKITSPTGNNGTRQYLGGQKTTLTWNVDKTIFGENSRVRILMSDDFGQSWKYTLIPDTANDGSEEITIPDIDLTERKSHSGGFTSAKGLFKIEVIDHIATAITDGGIKPNNGGFEIHKMNISSDLYQDPTLGEGLKGLVGINTENPKTGSWVTINSNNKGFVITRLNTIQINALTPQEGMIVFDTDQKCLKIYDGEKWSCFSTPATP